MSEFRHTEQPLPATKVREHHGPYTLRPVSDGHRWAYRIEGPGVEHQSEHIFESIVEAMWCGKQYGKQKLEEWV